MDTESDNYTYKTALLQFPSFPAIVLLIELTHLSSFHTDLFKKLIVN